MQFHQNGPYDLLVILTADLQLVDAYNVVSFEFVRHGSVSNASDHGGHRVVQFHEVLRTNGVKEALAEDNIDELDAVKGRVRGHTNFIRKLMFLRYVVLRFGSSQFLVSLIRMQHLSQSGKKFQIAK